MTTAILYLRLRDTFNGPDGEPIDAYTVYATVGHADCFRYCSPQILIILTPVRVELPAPYDETEEQREERFDAESTALSAALDDPPAVPFVSIVDQYKLANLAVSEGRPGAWTPSDMAACLRPGIEYDLCELHEYDVEEIAEGKPWRDVAAELEAQGAVGL